MKLGSFITAALLLVPVESYAADEVKLTSEFTVCLSEHELHGDLAILRCYGAELKRQNSRLNDSYRKALNRLPSAKAQELRNVQRLWVPYVEAKCGFLFDREEFNGTSAQVDAATCAVSERARRAKELDAIAPRVRRCCLTGRGDSERGPLRAPADVRSWPEAAIISILAGDGSHRAL